MNPCIVIQLWK